MDNIEEANGVVYSSGYRTLISVPAGITEIVINSATQDIFGEKEGSYAFLACASSIQKFSFSGPSPLLERIQAFSFYKCAALQSADLSMCTHLISIGEHAFFECSKLSVLKFPNSKLGYIYQQCFRGTAIQSVFFPESIKSIGPYSFHSCYKLSKIEFAKNIQLTYLADHLFISSIITEITIPKNIQAFHATALEGCGRLLNIYVDPENLYLRSENGIAYSKDNKTIFRYPAKADSNFDIPEGVTIIGPSCFVGSAFSSIKLPSTLRIIRNYAFQCSGLKSVIIPNSVETIEASAFTSSPRLSYVQLSSSLKYLAERTFIMCNLSSIIIPDGVISIGDKCFQGNRFLESVQLPSSISSIGGGVFLSTHPDLIIKFGNDSTLFIDSQMMLMNTKVTVINQYLGSIAKANITIPQTIQEIKTSAFYKSSIYSIVFEGVSSLTIIGESAFADCKTLVFFDFPPSIVTIRNTAFLSCSSLTNVILFEKVTFIGESAFLWCLSIKNITILASHLELSKQCFAKCVRVEHISINEGVTKIGESCFSECGFPTISLPLSLIEMGDYAFTQSKLESVIFHKECTIQSIPDFCFEHCTQMNQIEFPDSLVTLGRYCFSNTSIVKFVLPLSVNELKESCFADCHLLESFEIPRNSLLTTIGMGIFGGCYNLSTITSNCSQFVNENGALFNSDRSRLIAFPPASKIHFFAFPQSVKTVSQSAFIGCHNLKNILIPDDSVEVISIRAFEDCANLLYINIPLCITSIGSGAFHGCKKIQCGITVENRTESFISHLVQVCELPKNSLRSCACSLRQINLHYRSMLISPFISIFTMLASNTK